MRACRKDSISPDLAIIVVIIIVAVKAASEVAGAGEVVAMVALATAVVEPWLGRS